MTQDLLVAATIESKNFAALVSTYTAPLAMPIFVLMEAQPQHVVKQEERQDLLQFALFHADMDFTPYTSGRIFHEQGELRWERLREAIHIVYTGNENYQPALQNTQEIVLNEHDYKKSPRHYFLFGKRLDSEQLDRIGPVAQPGDFAEVRIPRLLRYPNLPKLAHVERVQLAVYEYMDLKTASNAAYRFHDLVVPSQKSQE